MKCDKAQELMSQAMDGELDARARLQVDQHVAGCPACQAARQAWQQAGSLLRTEAVAIPPAEVMWADVQRAIRLAEPVHEPVAAGWRLRWAGLGVGLLLLGAGLWGSLRGPPQAAVAQFEPVVEWAEAELPGTSTMVYEDADSDTVVIWLMTAENGEAPKGT